MKSAQLRQRALTLALVEAEDGQQRDPSDIRVAELDTALQHGFAVELEPLLISHACRLLIVDHLDFLFDADAAQRPPHLLGLLALALLILAYGVKVALDVQFVQQIFDSNLEAGPVAIVHVVEARLLIQV